jgi:hypothetical protein
MVADNSMPSGQRCDPIVDDNGEPVVPPEAIEEEEERRERELIWWEEQQAAAPGTTIVKVAGPGAPTDGAGLIKKWLPVVAAVFLLLRGGGD